MKLSDISGVRFGNCVSLKIHSKHKKCVKWECLCDCGEIFIAASNNLKSGNTKSCGCLKIRASKRRIDLTGMTFGRLKVDRVSHTINGSVSWVCKCSCGNTTTAKASKLLRGSTKSCGCYQDEVRGKCGAIGPIRWAKTIKDNFGECASCGSKEMLHAHHIHPVSTNKDLTRVIANGIALCKTCHIKLHRKYGKETIGSVELMEFIGGSANMSKVIDLIVCRHRRKNGKEDLLKAIHEIQLLIELEYGE